jgi:hypothetical protein
VDGADGLNAPLQINNCRFTTQQQVVTDVNETNYYGTGPTLNVRKAWVNVCG